MLSGWNFEIIFSSKMEKLFHIFQNKSTTTDHVKNIFYSFTEIWVTVELILQFE